MKLWIQPDIQSTAPRAMAIDRALLDYAKSLQGACFRHYTWSTPSWSFGYSQRLDEVQNLLPGKREDELVRRPTGGGIVSHEDDWTYALILPKEHPIAQSPARSSYQIIHKAIASALALIGVSSNLAPCNCQKRTKPGICFKEPVPDDVMEEGGSKIAGAAQKRTRSGLLIQGSINKQMLEGKESIFKTAFIQALEDALQVTPKERDFLPAMSDKITHWESRIASTAWLKLR